jgi:hypothetical protein
VSDEPAAKGRVANKGQALLVRRSTPPQKAKEGVIRELLRHDFYYACAYCSISEVEAQGISFHIEHHKPKKTKDADVEDYDNKMYACYLCNGYKSDEWPTPEEMALGMRFLRPDQDDYAEHFELKADVVLHPLTTPAQYTELLLRLNRDELKRLRDIRKRLFDVQNYVRGGLQALADVAFDALPAEIKTRVRQHQRGLIKEATQLAEVLERQAIVRLANRSPLLAPDPQRHADNSNRKRRLSEMRVMLANPQPPEDQE